MADIKQITIGTTPYDIKDETARNSISALQGISDATFKTALLNLFYPVGSYYETSDTSFNPNTAWGGTWESEVEGQVHISAGTNYSVAGALINTSDGGSKNAVVVSHSHVIAAHNTNSSGACTTGYMSANASHNHYLSTSANTVAKGSSWDRPRAYGSTSSHTYTTNSVNTNHTHSVPNHVHSIPQMDTNAAGVDGTDKNMQPYIIVKRWHRTA